MKRVIGEVTIRFTEEGWRPVSINDLIEHTQNALEAYRFEGSALPYADGEVVAAKLIAEALKENGL